MRSIPHLVSATLISLAVLNPGSSCAADLSSTIDRKIRDEWTEAHALASSIDKNEQRILAPLTLDVISMDQEFLDSQALAKNCIIFCGGQTKQSETLEQALGPAKRRLQAGELHQQSLRNIQDALAKNVEILKRLQKSGLTTTEKLASRQQEILMLFHGLYSGTPLPAESTRDSLARELQVIDSLLGVNAQASHPGVPVPIDPLLLAENMKKSEIRSVPDGSEAQGAAGGRGD